MLAEPVGVELRLNHMLHKSVNQMTSPMALKLHGKGAYERLPRSATPESHTRPLAGNFR